MLILIAQKKGLGKVPFMNFFRKTAKKAFLAVFLDFSETVFCRELRFFALHSVQPGSVLAGGEWLWQTARG